MNEAKIIKFYKLASVQAELFSKDPSKKVCALFIAPESHQILSAGYNGLPRKIKETDERWNKPEKYNFIVHAEKNGIYNACRNGVSLKDSICIVTFFPCSECARALIQVGVKTIISPYPDFDHITYGESFKYSLEMFKEVDISILYINNEKA
jgi:dCMP deaminase